MKSKYVQFAVVAVTLTLVIWFLTRVGNSSSSRGAGGNASTIHGMEAARSENHQPQNTRARAKPMDETTKRGKGRYYEIVGPSSTPLELSEEQVMGRVAAGLKRLKSGTSSTDDKPMPNLREAFRRLVHDEVFMDRNFPIWGIECEEYFVYSGYPDCDPRTPFEYGYAVRKADGKIFQWWAEVGN